MSNEIDGMEKPSPSVRESIALTNLRQKLLLVSNQAAQTCRVATHSETMTLAERIQRGADAEISRIEEMLR